MVKIHILGGPGSGKTTLAECLSSRLHVPHHDLDKIGWKHGARSAGYIEDAFAIAEQPAWITENIGLTWIDPLLYHADCIVLLEVSWPVAAWRILRRHISKSLRGTNPYPTKLLFNFLKDSRRYYTDKVSADPSVAEYVRAYLAEQHASAEPPDAERLLIDFEKGMKTIPLTADFTRMYLEKYKKKLFLVRNNADRERLFALLTNM